MKGTPLKGVTSPSGPRRRYRRAAAIFAAVFILASAAVVWVALREVEREKLIRENERIAGLERAADGTVERISESLQGKIARLKSIAATLAPSAAPDEIRSLFLRPSDASNIFQEIFLVEPGKEPDPLSSRLPFAPSSGEDTPLLPPAASETDSFIAAERLEFQAKDFPAAISAYERALSDAATEISRGRTLHALARTYRKSERREKAIEAFDRVSEEFRLVPSEDGSPLGILAAIEIGSIRDEMSRQSQALEAWLSLYGEIFSGAFNLSGTQFWPFLSLLDDLIEPVVKKLALDQERLKASERWLELKRRAKEIADRVKVHELFRDHFFVATAAAAALPTPSVTPASPAFQTKMIDGALWIAVTAPLQGPRSLKALLDERTLINEFVSPALPSDGQAPGMKAAVVDVSGRIIFGADTPSTLGAALFQRTLPDPLSLWILRLVDDRPVRREPEFRRRRNLYFGAAALLLAVLFAGGWTTLRGMAKDMEVATLKSDFVATVSHELRTPLTGIRALSELLKNDRVPDDQTRKRYGAILHKESERLSGMIENILDFSKIEAGLKEYRRALTDPVELTRETAARFQDWTADKGFRVDLRIDEPLPPIFLDAEAISRALLNVLDNAAKYSGEAREIEISVRAEGQALIWKVRDLGLGIPVADLPRVFDKFFRSRRNPDTPVRGSGIGLTIVKHIIEAHKGTVTVASAEGKGTTVRISIPMENGHGQTDA